MAGQSLTSGALWQETGEVPSGGSQQVPSPTWGAVAVGRSDYTCIFTSRFSHICLSDSGGIFGLTDVAPALI